MAGSTGALFLPPTAGLNPGLLFARLAFMGALLGLYFLFEWKVLCSGLRDVLWHLFDMIGEECAQLEVHGKFFLVFDNGYSFSISRACTYVDVLLILLPFAWRFQRAVKQNMRRVAVLAVILTAGNVTRVFVSIFGYQMGYSWQAVHVVPDFLIHFLLVSAFAWLALVADSGIGRMQSHYS